MKQLEIKANALGQLRLLKQSTFKDPLAFIDENVQNAQRAGAKKICIDFYKDQSNKSVIAFHNDGEILDDFQKLFSMNETGWSKEVQEREEPFGIGFFSNVAVAENLEIFSGQQSVALDIPKILQSGSLELDVQTCENVTTGFQLILRNLDSSVVNSWKVKDRVTMLGECIPDLEVIYNDVAIPKKDLFEIDKQAYPFSTTVEEEGFKGWLALSTGFPEEVKIFCHGRLVTELDLFAATGEIHVESGVLNLTAPDRKDIIRDNKKLKFEGFLETLLELIAQEAVVGGNREAQDKFSMSIERWYRIANPSDYERIKFTTVKCNEKGLKYLEKVILDGEAKAKSFHDRVYVEPTSIAPEEHFEEIVTESSIKVAPVPHISSGGYCSGTSNELSSSDTEEKNLKSVDVTTPTFYVKQSELSMYREKILICRHYNLNLILSQNRFQTSVLSSLQKKGIVFPLSSLEERITLRTSLSNTTLSTPEEERAYALLKTISTWAGLDHCGFAIGDLMVSRVLCLPEIAVEEIHLEENVTAIYCKEHEKVYVDRTMLRGLSLLQPVEDQSEEVLTMGDIRFILLNATTLSKELSFQNGKAASDVLSTILDCLGGM